MRAATIRFAFFACLLAGAISCGGHEDPGRPTESRLPAEVVSARGAGQTTAIQRLIPESQATTRPAKQILFGDLHVHTTFSADAFMRSLPMLQGEGAHPPADSCDFARFCSSLDLWSINDHSESVTAQHWLETKESIRQCNAMSGNPSNPEL